jgi:hypothetical protein
VNEGAAVGPDVTPVDPSPTPTDASAFDTMTDAQRSDWLQTGTPPGQTADSAPASPDDQVASTEASTSPASEPGKPAKKRGIDARNEELEQKILRLNENLSRAKQIEQEWEATQRRLQERAPTAESRPASAGDGEPQEAEFASYSDYVKALGQWSARQAFREEQAAIRAHQVEAEHARALSDTAKSAADRLEAARARDPEFDTKIHPQLLAVVPASALPDDAPVGPQHILADEILRSEVVDQLLVHFSAQPADWQRLCALPTPAALMRAFVQLESSFARGEASASGHNPSISQAPTPPVTLGRKPSADNADPGLVALRKGDFAAYMESENRKEVSRSRGR